MGMEFVFVGTLRVRFRNLADDKKILAASVRILSKLCREISCVTAFLSFENN